MGDKSAIEWTDATWNPVTGCTKVSQGCKNCYAERVFPRAYGGRKFSDVRTHPDRLDQPLRWKKTRRIFVNSMSDLFHEDVPDTFILQTLAVMAAESGHTFQILTKRPERLRAFMNEDRVISNVTLAQQMVHLGKWPAGLKVQIVWPLPNVWLGVSVEDQATADERIPLLLQTPATVRFLSCEPLLGPIRLTGISYGGGLYVNSLCVQDTPEVVVGPAIDWVIAGGESGPRARPSHPDWFRALRDECAAFRVPYFFKQWGEWAPFTYIDKETGHKLLALTFTKREIAMGGPADGTTPCNMKRMGKREAGRELDGRTHDEYPA